MEELLASNEKGAGSIPVKGSKHRGGNMSLNFEEQVESFDVSKGLVYYLEKHKRRWMTLSECQEEIYKLFVALNEYAPMQLQGVKTDDELKAMAKSAAPKRFKTDTETSLSVRCVAVNTNDPEGLAQTKQKTEEHQDFVRWCTPFN